MIKRGIKKILVPIDGSPNSNRGLEEAIILARECKATLTGVYAIYEPPHTEFQTTGSLRKEVTQEVKKLMEKSKTLAAQSGIVFKEKIAYGNIGYNIVKLAHSKKEKFDLIVIGSRGRSSFKEMFLGSVSNYVLHTSKIPVLVVK